MTGAAALVVGLLLVLTWAVTPRIPGEATFASPGVFASPPEGTLDRPRGLARRAWNPARAFLLSPIHPATWYATVAVLLGFVVGVSAFAFVASIFSSAVPSLFFGVGFVLLAVGIEGSRIVARIERRRVALGGARLIPHPYRRLTGGFWGVVRAEFGDEDRWRDVLYVGINMPLAILEFAVVGFAWCAALALLTAPVWYDAAGGSLPDALGPLIGHDLLHVVARAAIGAALLPVAASISQLVMALHRGVVAGLLCTSEARELRRQVATLRESRSAVLDAEATELHRIERDLHDGAQQRLVMLAIDLGLASERIDSDPETARRLVLEGRDQAQQALSDIRSLVRGIAPAILLDRGLVAALGSLASHSTVPTSIRSDLEPGARLPEAVERTAYFVASEALANAAKHSHARRCEVRCRREGACLVVEVQDDGVGGARFTQAGGLTGLAGRVEAVDGRIALWSPSGGPTIVRADIPVQAWSPAPPPSAPGWPPPAR